TADIYDGRRIIGIASRDCSTRETVGRLVVQDVLMSIRQGGCAKQPSQSSQARAANIQQRNTLASGPSATHRIDPCAWESSTSAATPYTCSSWTRTLAPVRY